MYFVKVGWMMWFVVFFFDMDGLFLDMEWLFMVLFLELMEGIGIECEVVEFFFLLLVGISVVVIGCRLVEFLLVIVIVVIFEVNWCKCYVENVVLGVLLKDYVFEVFKVLCG